jgi:hypothetical protein
MRSAGLGQLARLIEDHARVVERAGVPRLGLEIAS